MKESSLARWSIAELRRAGFYCVKISPPVEDGTPDILGCAHGVFFGIELKRPGKKARKNQQWRATQILGSGGLCFIASKRMDVRSIILTLQTMRKSNISIPSSPFMQQPVSPSDL